MACRPAGGRPVAVIEHLPAEETQWDWLDLPDPPAGWDGYGATAHLLVGALSHSGKWRGMLSEATDQPQLIDAQHQVVVRLGGLTRVWRFDRMATVVHPASGKVTASYAAVATTMGCRSNRAHRGGATARVWSRRPTTPRRNAGGAPCPTTSPSPTRRPGWTSSAPPKAMPARVDVDGNRCTVADLAANERLAPLPAAAFPAEVSVPRQVTPLALVSFRGNRYSVPPELAGGPVTVTHRLGSPVLSFATDRGVTVALHHRVADGTGATIRSEHHVTALNKAALAAFSTARPHRRKERIPPGPAALFAAEALRGNTTDTEPVVDLAVYAAAAQARRNLT